MNFLYVALNQSIPGTTGGSTHVTAVARGLAALGHEVHVLTGAGTPQFPTGVVHWHQMQPPLGIRHLRLLRTSAVLDAARDVTADAVIERYHNFGGEGLVAAKRLGLISVLEVNAPVIDYPGSPKRIIDRLLIAEPMRRWREWQCRTADLIVTPDARILPSTVPRDRIVELEWGADTDRFHPRAGRATVIERAPGDTVAVFAGAFRAWHGAVHLVAAIRRLRSQGRHDIKAMFIGDGPELSNVQRMTRDLDGISFLGAVPHDDMPAYLAVADIGVAPFDVSAHGPLRLGFYWSPLKIFEYMAAGLPIVAPRIDRLTGLVSHGREGLLYDGSQEMGLASALAELTDPARRAALGAAARERVVREFSWTAHCRQLDAAIARAIARRRASSSPTI